MASEWLTRKLAIERYHLSSSSLTRMMHNGLPFSKQGEQKNAKVLFDSELFENFLRNNLRIIKNGKIKKKKKP